MKKKLIFLFILISSFSFASVSDISFIVKGGIIPIGIYGELLRGKEDKLGSTNENVYFRNSINIKGEFHSRSRNFNSLFWGAGIGYIGMGNLDKELGGSKSLNIDYYPIYLLMHLQYPSNYYYNWDMFFNFRGGIAYARDRGRLSKNSGIDNPMNTPAPYFGFSTGFESSNLILELFYDLTGSITIDKTIEDTEDIGDILGLWSHRFGVNVGYRFNMAWY